MTTTSHPLRLLALALTLIVSLLGAQVALAQGGGDTKTKAGPDKAVTLAKKMQSFYNGTKDYQAYFNQTYTDLAAGSSKKSFGRVFFKQPGKMRWDYHKKKKGSKKAPREKVLVSDGKVFWIYEHEFQQVFKRCLAESQLPTSLKFLLGQGDLLKDFNVAMAKKSTDAKPILRLEPKSDADKAKYKRLTFQLDPKTFQVVRTTIYDPYGNTNTIVFSKVLVNKNLPDSGFTFKKPKNARLLNPQKSCK